MSTPATTRCCPIVENIPVELRERRQWVNHRQKIPYTPGTNHRADATDPTTWRSFAEALNAYQRGGWDGIGFVFSADDPYTGIDLDKCRDPETGTLDPWAQGIIRWFRSYTEVSPSGRGVHIIIRGTLPPGGRKKGRIELYDSGRYFTMTGQALEVAS